MRFGETDGIVLEGTEWIEYDRTYESCEYDEYGMIHTTVIIGFTNTIVEQMFTTIIQ